MELTSGKEIEPLLRETIAAQIGQKKLDRWFPSSIRFDFRGERLAVLAPQENICGFLRSYRSEPLASACRQLFGREVPLDFLVEEAPLPGKNSLSPVVDVTTSRDSIRLRGAEPAPAPSPAASSSLPRRKTERSGRVFASYDSFVVGVSNSTAKSIADIAIRTPGMFNPILFHGPTSVGKTHLLEGIYSEYRKNSGRKRPKFLSADEFTGLFVQGFQEKPGGDRSFRARFLDANLLVIDDIQNLEKREATQRELTHLIDILQSKGVQVVLSADRPIAEMTFLKPELRTRLGAGVEAGIETPERETLLKIFNQMARQRGLEIPDEVGRFVVSRLAVHARQLSGVINRLHLACLTGAGPLTPESAAGILADLTVRRQTPVTLEEIEKAIASVFGIQTKELRGRSRARQCSHPRMLAMWLARKYTRSALSEIGRFFGGRSHSTVAAAQKKIDLWLSGPEGAEFSDPLKRVEQLLAASRH